MSSILITEKNILSMSSLSITKQSIVVPSQIKVTLENSNLIFEGPLGKICLDLQQHDLSLLQSKGGQMQRLRDLRRSHE